MWKCSKEFGDNTRKKAKNQKLLTFLNGRILDLSIVM